jgi:hypothetical protein
MAIEFVAPQRRERVITVGGTGCDLIGFNSVAIQRAIDLARSAGCDIVKLDEGTFEMIGPVRLYDNITLTGCGDKTILYKIDGFKTRFVIDADYSELQATVEDVSGFRVGMGIQLYDDANANGWNVTTAVITAIDDKTIYFDNYLVRDYSSERNGVISNACSLIEAVEASGVTISNLCIEGNKERNEPINGCRGGAIYFHKAQDCRVVNVKVRSFSGDGISWQVTDRISVIGCEVEGCSNFGMHPGTGSSLSRVENCESHHNGSDGLFVCWRVQHGSFRNNKLHDNGGQGISIGHKDTDNLFEGNHIYENRGCGVYVRKESVHNGAHRNRYVRNTIENNGGSEYSCGMLINGSVAGIVIEDNIIRDTGASRQKVGIRIKDGVTQVTLQDNVMSGHQADVLEE